MRCARCGWPVEETETVSSHITSEGWVRYRRCVCGAVFLQPARTGDRIPGTTNGTPAR